MDDVLSFSLLPSLPSQFSPVLWLDANDSSSFSPVNGKVSEWQDKSGNDYHYSQNVISKRPLLFFILERFAFSYF